VGPSNDNLIIAVAANGATSSSITSSLQDKGASRVWRSYRMEIGPRVDLPSYLEVRFFVDGDYLGRVQNDATSTYIPSATVLCAPRVERLSGVTSKGMLVDYFQHQVAPT
jgi:hypothetical protein